MRRPMFVARSETAPLAGRLFAVAVRALPVVLALAAAAIATQAQAQSQSPAKSEAGLDLTQFEIVDLSHAFDEDTIYWPTSPTKFELTQLNYGPTPGGWFYAANSISTPEHGGTHLDAPVHFGEGRHTVDQVPLQRLIGPAIVIDVSGKASAYSDYRLSLEDVKDFEVAHGEIEPGTIVLMKTGYSRFWPDRLRYLGDDTPGDASNLHFPSYGQEAADYLVNQRQVAALGVDTASIDYGPSTDFLVHRIAATRNVPGLENLTGLEALPPRGATIFALPMKIKGGSGGPARVIALVPAP